MEIQIEKSASHGPTSSEGKAISSCNAIKHGGCATGTLVLPTESLEDFLALESCWFKAYRVRPDQADDAYKAELIRDAVRTEWFSLRVERNYAEIEAQIMHETPNPLQWNDRQHHAIQRFMRYKTANANALSKSRKALEDYCKARGKCVRSSFEMSFLPSTSLLTTNAEDSTRRSPAICPFSPSPSQSHPCLI